ncbi:hypothetical protein CJU90_1206 [Yarrowia sp. C11]|nr:hypothetical protein CKK34_2620 [Yarrowia sp. E02]KAG5373493.1 hypothetical protein CJU90_1206 [Yarrowia sp. C11]
MSLPTFEQPKKSWLSLPSNPVTRLKQSLFFNVQNSPYVKSRDEILGEIDTRHRQDTHDFLELQKAAVDLMAVGELSGTYKTVDYVIPEPEKEKGDDSDDDSDDEEEEEDMPKAGSSGGVTGEETDPGSQAGPSGSSGREGLFRPCSEESYELLSYLPLPFTKPCTVYRTGYVCEAAASVLNALLGFNVVPLTRVTSVRGKLGSLIELDDNAIAAFEYFKANGEDNTPEWLNLEIQKLAVVDWLCRNMNRTPGNWYINAATEQIHGNGLDTGYDSCFPYKHPWMFRWNLPTTVTSAPWSEEIRARVVPLLTSKEWWQVASDALYHTYFDNHDDFEEGFWNSQWAIFRGQAYLLLSNLLRKDSTPDDLSRGHPKLMIAYDGGMDKAQRGVELYIEPKGN